MNVYNMLDKLKKIYQKNGITYPSKTDPDGMPHPEHNQRIKTTASNGEAVWANKPEIAKKHENQLKNEYIKMMNAKKFSPQHNEMIRSLAQHVVKSKDRHVIGSGTEPNAETGYKEMRLRHLLSAIRGDYGYSLKPIENGLQIKAERHAKNKPIETTTWIWDGKKLISNGKKIKDFSK